MGCRPIIFDTSSSSNSVQQVIVKETKCVDLLDAELEGDDGREKEIVQSLKEIVNSPEVEIYAMLKDCNMDPNEAVHRLLSQDPFHEVKSKKEKKRETRDIPDPRLRGANNTYNRGGRGASDRYAGRTGSSHFTSTGINLISRMHKIYNHRRTHAYVFSVVSGSGNFQGKYTNKKESGTHGYTSSRSSASRVANHHQTPHSDSVVTENKLPSAPSGDGISSSQSASVHQTAWFGAPGKMSMADIVKMGRPQNKTTNSQQNVNMRSEMNHEHEANASHQVPVKDEWPSIEKPLASVSADSEVCNGPADLQSDRVDQHLSDRLENIHLAENGPSENLGVDHVQQHDSVSGRNVHEDESRVSSEFNDNQYTYQTQSHPLEHHKDEDEVSSDSADFQQLTVDSHDQESSHEEDRPAVLIPNHLLIHSEECSQLSFGSFGGFGSRPLSNNAEETPDVAQQTQHLDARELDFQYSPFAQSMQSRNNNNASSLGDQSISMPEALRGNGVPATQQTLPGVNIATGPAPPPQQLPMHPYSQPTMPLAHFANMLGYPLIPQNYTYMPSAFPQTFAGNSLYQQQLAALLPQYKTNLGPSNLSQSATAPASSAYGNSTNVGSAGNFPLNQHSTPGTTMGYEDVLSSQYKESNHLLALQQQQQQQQNENSAMWHHGHGSRTMSGVPASTYYNLQAQQQQLLQQAQQAAGGYRQAQQQQNYGSHGYPNYYQSQSEMSVDRQQQNPRDGAGAQAGQASNQTQQLWQNSY
ncbi:hypothetical protein Bca4012_056292 [Brassica carinata]